MKQPIYEALAMVFAVVLALSLQVSNTFTLPARGELIGEESVISRSFPSGSGNFLFMNDVKIEVGTVKIEQSTGSFDNSKMINPFALPVSGELIGGESGRFQSAPPGNQTLIIVEEETPDSIEVTIEQPVGFPGNCGTVLTVNPSKIKDSYKCEGQGNSITLTNKGPTDSIILYRARALP